MNIKTYINAKELPLQFRSTFIDLMEQIDGTSQWLITAEQIPSLVEGWDDVSTFTDLQNWLSMNKINGIYFGE